jgi:hypothetical protein
MHAEISETAVLSAAHSLVSLGLRKAGYEYVNIDVYISPTTTFIFPTLYLPHLRTAGPCPIATPIQTNWSPTH